jgi:hypothetical protein
MSSPRVLFLIAGLQMGTPHFSLAGLNKMRDKRDKCDKIVSIAIIHYHPLSPHNHHVIRPPSHKVHLPISLVTGEFSNHYRRPTTRTRVLKVPLPDRTGAHTIRCADDRFPHLFMSFPPSGYPRQIASFFLFRHPFHSSFHSSSILRRRRRLLCRRRLLRSRTASPRSPRRHSPSWSTLSR